MGDSPPAPVLYSFRRCPYAMRARLALLSSLQRCEMREILLRDKPECMLAYSPKGTVPVLVLASGEVIDESRDIMSWALDQHDPQMWKPRTRQAEQRHARLVEHNDGPFKHHLDRYKYANRYEGADAQAHRTEAEHFIRELETCLHHSAWLSGAALGLTDAAIAPFIRQFANTDRAWFEGSPYPAVKHWLGRFLDEPIFEAAMVKYPVWCSADTAVYFPKAVPPNEP